jgi:hypothetical protein
MRRSIVGTVVAVVVLATTPAHAGPDPTWVREVGSTLQDVATVPGGGIAVAGAKGDAMLVRVYGVGGALRWSRTWRPHGWTVTGIAPNATARGVAVGPSGEVYVGGILGAGCEGGGWFLRAYGPDGRLRWHREEVGWRRCRATTTAIGMDADGRGMVVAIDRFGCCDDPSSEGWVRAYGPGGRIRWIDPFEVPGIPVAYSDHVFDVVIASGGTIYAVGRVSRTAEAELDDRFDRDAVVRALSSDGRPIWTRVVGSRTRSWEDAFTVDVQGTRLLVGGTSDGSSWLRELTTSGAVLRTWHWWGSGVGGVAVAPNGATYAVGGRLVRKLGPGGSVVWTTKLEGASVLGVAADAGGASVVGHINRPDLDGRLWRFAA